MTYQIPNIGNENQIKKICHLTTQPHQRQYINGSKKRRKSR